MLQVNYESFKCQWIKFSVTEVGTWGEMQETNNDFNYISCILHGRSKSSL